MTEINNIEKEELEWLEMEKRMEEAEQADRAELEVNCHCSDDAEAYDD